MRPRLAGAAASGVSPKILSFLNDGDVDALLAFHRETFGDAKMEGDDGGDDADGDDSDDDADGDDEDGAEGDTGSDKKPDPRIKELSDEAKKYRLRHRESRTRIAELEKQIAELSKGNKSSDKKDDQGDKDQAASSEELKRVQSEAEKLAQTNEDLRIQLEFLASNKYSWKNPKTALRLLDRSDVEITDDGVEGLEEAMDALAKSEPYLLKGKDDDDTDDAGKKRRSGDPSGTGRKGKGNPNRELILKKYPALRR